MKNRNFGVLAMVIYFSFLLYCPAVFARPDASAKFSLIRSENKSQKNRHLILPYTFATDSLGTLIGVGGMMAGYGQDQLVIAGTALASSDDAAIGMLGMWDYQLPVVNRWFFSAIGSRGYYPRQRIYDNGPRPAGASYAGSNDSDKDDFIMESGDDNWSDFKLEYVLPLGTGKTSPIIQYEEKNGEHKPTGPIGNWNPFATGTTILLIKQYNRYGNIELPTGIEDYSAHPLKLGLYYSHVDYQSNPSTGSYQYIAYTSDFAWGDSEEKWDFAEFEASKFFNLGTNKYTKHQVIALNFWTGHSPSYTVTIDNEGRRQVSDNPPFTDGARLGGLYRMRGYPSSRFNDRSVIYGSAEYRWTPHWNPIGEISWLKFLQMDWMQFVPFVEVGRVADDYDPGELLSDMKVDEGVSFRAKMAGVVIRFDLVYCNEGVASYAMFGHPF